jgi:hypothetical protein
MFVPVSISSLPTKTTTSLKHYQSPKLVMTGMETSIPINKLETVVLI